MINRKFFKICNGLDEMNLIEKMQSFNIYNKKIEFFHSSKWNFSFQNINVNVKAKMGLCNMCQILLTTNQYFKN